MSGWGASSPSHKETIYTITMNIKNYTPLKIMLESQYEKDIFYLFIGLLVFQAIAILLIKILFKWI